MRAKLSLQREEIAGLLLFLILLTLNLVDAWSVIGGVATERNVQQRQESIHTANETLGRARGGFLSWFTIIHNNAICEVGGHDEIMFYDERGLLGVQDESLDDARGDDTLFDIQVRGRFIDKVDLSGLTQGQCQSNALQLTTGKMLNILIEERIDKHRLGNIGLELGMIELIANLHVEQISDLFIFEHEQIKCLITIEKLNFEIIAGNKNDFGWNKMKLNREKNKNLKSYRAIEFRGNGLGLVRHGVMRHLDFLIVGLEVTGEHTDECGLTGTVLTKHDQNFTVTEETTCCLIIFHTEAKISMSN